MTTTTAVVTVRDYTDADIEALREFFYEISRNVYRLKCSDEHLRTAVTQQIPGRMHCRWFLAEVDGVVIGFSSVGTVSRPPGVSIYVRPKHRGKGAGRALIARAMDHIRDSGARFFRAYAASPEQHRLYRRLGGVVVGVDNRLGLLRYKVPLGGPT